MGSTNRNTTEQEKALDSWHLNIRATHHKPIIRSIYTEKDCDWQLPLLLINPHQHWLHRVWEKTHVCLTASPRVPHIFEFEPTSTAANCLPPSASWPMHSAPWQQVEIAQERSPPWPLTAGPWTRLHWCFWKPQRATNFWRVSDKNKGFSLCLILSTTWKRWF